MSEFLEEKKNEILTLVQNKSPKKIMNIYKEVLDKIENLSKFYGFFAGTFLIDPDFYMDKVFKVYVKNITKMLNLENIFDLETYVLQNHCLYENEKIKATFRGEVNVGSGKMIGRIYVTNFRIILVGSSKGRGIPMVTTSLAGMAINKSLHKSLVKKMQSTMKQSTSSELPCFGHQYPMFGVKKIKLGNKSVSYRVALQHEYQSGHTSTKRYAFKIIPYGKNTGEILKVLYNTINEYNEMGS